MKDLMNFSVKSKEYEMFFAKDGHVEIYAVEDPGHTGFIFDEVKQFVLFINTLTDVLERKLSMEEKNED